MTRSKRIDNATKKLIHQLMDMAIDYEQDKFHIFVQYSPHCNLLQIYGFVDGWKNHKDRDFSIEVWIDGLYSDNSTSKLKRAINKIKKLYEDVQRAKR